MGYLLKLKYAHSIVPSAYFSSKFSYRATISGLQHNLLPASCGDIGLKKNIKPQNALTVLQALPTAEDSS
jgi:hypothetical protein